MPNYRDLLQPVKPTPTEVKCAAAVVHCVKCDTTTDVLAQHNTEPYCMPCYTDMIEALPDKFPKGSRENKFQRALLDPIIHICRKYAKKATADAKKIEQNEYVYEDFCDTCAPWPATSGPRAIRHVGGVGMCWDCFEKDVFCQEPIDEKNVCGQLANPKFKDLRYTDTIRCTKCYRKNYPKKRKTPEKSTTKRVYNLRSTKKFKTATGSASAA